MLGKAFRECRVPVKGERYWDLRVREVRDCTCDWTNVVDEDGFGDRRWIAEPDVDRISIPQAEYDALRKLEAGAGLTAVNLRGSMLAIELEKLLRDIEAARKENGR